MCNSNGEFQGFQDLGCFLLVLDGFGWFFVLPCCPLLQVYTRFEGGFWIG